MKFDIEPVDATFGAIVRGIKLNALDQATWAALYDAWLEYALLIFPGQHLTRWEQAALGRRFGRLELEMLPISNVKPDGTLYTPEQDYGMINMLRSTYNWHSDSTFTPIQAKGAVFCAEVIPSSGTQTGWADMRAAYDALDAAMRERVDGLNAIHSYHEKQARLGQPIEEPKFGVKEIDGKKANYTTAEQRQVRPIVKVHPETGRKCLLIGHHLVDIPGMEVEESTKFLDDLVRFACQPPRTYHYKWTAGDAVIWDNRCLLHRAVPWDFNSPRVMWHTRMAGDPVSEAALA